MKTLKEIQANEEYLDEKLNLRTISGVLLVGKSRTLEKQIKSIKIILKDIGRKIENKLRRIEKTIMLKIETILTKFPVNISISIIIKCVVF